MNKEGREYLSKYIKITEKIEKAINKHTKRYSLDGDICAWYANWEDFCSDWCDDCGYTRTEARKLLHGGQGEFLILPDNNGIIRYTI